MSIPSFPPNRLRRRLELKRENNEPEIATVDEVELVAPVAPKAPTGFSSTRGKSAFSVPSKRSATPYNGLQNHHYNSQGPLSSAVINCNQMASTQKMPPRSQCTNCCGHVVPNGHMMNIVPPRSSIVPPRSSIVPPRPSEVSPRSSFIPPMPYIDIPRLPFVPPRPSIDIPRPSIDIPRPPFVPPRPSIDIPRPLFVPARPSIDIPRPSFAPPRPWIDIPRPPFAPSLPSVVPSTSSIVPSIYAPASSFHTSMFPPASSFNPSMFPPASSFNPSNYLPASSFVPTSCVVPPASSSEINNVDENLVIIRKKHHIPPRTEAAKTNAFDSTNDAPIVNADSTRSALASLDNSNEIRGGQNIHLNPPRPNATNNNNLRENREELITPLPLQPSQSQLCLRCRKYPVIFTESDFPDSENELDYEYEIGRVPEGVFFVEKILKKRIHHGQEQYFVKWMSYPRCYNSWEPRPSFLNQVLIETFEKKLQDKLAAKKSKKGKKRRQTRTR